jgi:MoaA/NifB/PqqE/SkfB family radical SAM enzyme
MEYHIPRILHLREFGYSFPAHMILGLVTYCDQFCPHCYAGLYRFNPKLKLTASLDVLKNALRSASCFGEHFGGQHPIYSKHTMGLKAVTLVGSGEPLLYPYLKELLEYLHQELNLEIGIYTNGHMLRDGVTRGIFDSSPQDIASLVLSTCRFVRVSLDAATPETHFLERGVKDQFHQIIDNLTRLTKARRSAGKDEPTVGIQFTVDDHNVHEIEAVARLAKQIGVDYLAYKPKYVPWHLQKERMTDMTFSDVEYQLHHAQQYASDNLQIHGKFDQFRIAWGPQTNNSGEHYQQCRHVWLSAYLDVDIASADYNKADMRIFLCANKDKEEKNADGCFKWSLGPVTAKTDFIKFWADQMPHLVKRIELPNCIAGCKNDPFNQILDTMLQQTDEQLKRRLKSLPTAVSELHVNYI